MLTVVLIEPGIETVELEVMTVVETGALDVGLEMTVVEVITVVVGETT